MLAGFLVVVLIKHAHEVLEDGAHGVVVEAGQLAHGTGAEVDVLVEELLDELAEAVGLGEPGDLIAKLEVLEDVLHVRREAVEVGHEVVLERLLRLAGLEVAQEEGRGVVEGLTGGGAEGVVLVGDFLAVERDLHFEHSLLGRLQHGVEAAENGHRQDDVAVFAAHEDVAEGVIGDAPDEVGDPVELSLVHEIIFGLSA